MSSRRNGLLEWRKESGYAGEKTIERMRKQAEDAGWKRGREMDDAHPDGSWVARGDVYVSPDGQIEMSYYSHYGATSYDNSFSITFKMVGGAVNESDEEDSFTRSDRPQIYKYYDDDETPIEEFVKKVRDAEQMVEDIFIQNSNYYENEVNPWETFCDDMCDGESPEEAFDLDYYMNQAAYDQLPEDIRKYTHFSTGTCDFDAMQWLYGVFERLMPICKDPVSESSRFGFNVGDKVELKVGKEPNRFGGWGKIEAGSQGEIVAIDKPMPGAIKVKLEDGTVVTMGILPLDCL